MRGAPHPGEGRTHPRRRNRSRIFLPPGETQPLKTKLDTVLAYHQRSKHHLQRYAAGPQGLDWKNQPEPFRVFSGCPTLALPLSTEKPLVPYTDLYRSDKPPPCAMSLQHIAALLELSLGLSAWKQHGEQRWALRCNPSSGNLHPTEAYVVVAAMEGVEDGVHHYVSRDHALEHRCHFDVAADADAIALSQDTFLLGLSSIHWREAWKYGERAYRYCQHDAGHAMAAVRYAAALLGWQVQAETAWSDAEVGELLGVNRESDFSGAETEHPDVLLRLSHPRRDKADNMGNPDILLRAVRNGRWRGHANALSPRHGQEWPVIEAVAAACNKPRTQETAEASAAYAAPLPGAGTHSAVDIILQRRSAQAFDGTTAMPLNSFYRMLDMTLPRRDRPPWDMIGWGPRVHLALFVHRVEGLSPGIYLLLREARREGVVRAALSADFQWQRPEDCPAHLPLFRLVTADARNAARTISCHQEIAADGAFSLAMLAEYAANLTDRPWLYRQLFWETGLLGQVLYLEAEAAGLRGTGIGCYFDDVMHEVLGLQDQSLQSLYHFTVGGAVTDARLQTLPPYAHLQRI